MNLQSAIEIALEAHKGALDKGGDPYNSSSFKINVTDG